MTSDELRRYLGYYHDLGIKTLYRRAAPEAAGAVETTEPALLSDAAPELPAPAVPEPANGNVEAVLAVIREDIGDCKRCRLHERRTQIVFGVGDAHARLVFVGEGPGADEDAQGIPFVGRAGQLLTQMIENTAKREGIPLERKDVYICNVVKCRPPENRTPEPDEMEICG